MQGEGEGAPKVEYRVWNPFRSKIAAGILVRARKATKRQSPPSRMPPLPAIPPLLTPLRPLQGGLEEIYIKPGTKLLYLGGASGTTVSHCSDIVGPTGLVYAVEFSHRSGRDLVNMAKKRTNVIPIIEDARHPQRYRMLVGMVDTVFADVAQPDQARIVALNASYFLKAGGNFVISIKARAWANQRLLDARARAR